MQIFCILYLLLRNFYYVDFGLAVAGLWLNIFMNTLCWQLGTFKYLMYYSAFL